MVIICPIGWGMAQRGARVNIKNASCNYNVTLARQIDEAESQLTWSTGCSPSGSSSCDIQDRPQSTLRPGWQNWSGLDSWEGIWDCGRSFGFAHLYIFYPLEALVEREVVPNCVLKLLPRLEFVSRSMHNPSQFASFLPLLLPRFQNPIVRTRLDLALRWKTPRTVCNLNKVVQRMQLVYSCFVPRTVGVFMFVVKNGVNLILRLWIVASLYISLAWGQIFIEDIYMNTYLL